MASFVRRLPAFACLFVLSSAFDLGKEVNKNFIGGVLHSQFFLHLLEDDITMRSNGSVVLASQNGSDFSEEPTIDYHRLADRIKTDNNRIDGVLNGRTFFLFNYQNEAVNENKGANFVLVGNPEIDDFNFRARLVGNTFFIQVADETNKNFEFGKQVIVAVNKVLRIVFGNQK